MMNRREFIIKSSMIVVGTSFSGLQGFSTSMVRFGVVTDPHYADTDPATYSNRYYRDSIEKMDAAIKHFNNQNLDFIIEVGDFKDQDPQPEREKTLQYLKAIEQSFTRFKGPKYHVLGNHDMDSLSKREFLQNIENTGIPKQKSYYSYDKKGIHFIVLDANFTRHGIDYNNGNFDWTDTNINHKQVKWLQKDLEKTDNPTIVFVHQRLDTPYAHNKIHCIHNARKVRHILERSGKVMAVFQGHDHAGGYSKIHDIHYFTQVAMVSGPYPDNNSYSIVEVMKNGDIRVTGYVNCESRIMNKLDPVSP